MLLPSSLKLMRRFTGNMLAFADAFGHLDNDLERSTLIHILAIHCLGFTKVFRTLESLGEHTARF